MPVGICPKHKRTEFIEMCEHIDTSFRNEIHEHYHQLYYWFDLKVCDNCWIQFNFAYFENHPEIFGKRYYEMFEDIDEEFPIMKEYDEAYSKLSRKFQCKECINEI